MFWIPFITSYLEYFSFCWETKAIQFSSVQLLSHHVWLFVTLWTAASQASLSIRTFRSSSSCPLSWWCHPTISSSVIPFSSCLQSFPASQSFPMSQFFASVAKVLEIQLQHQSVQWIFKLTSFRIDWFDLLVVQGTLWVFSSTTVQKHQFFSAQLSLWSNSHIHTWLLEKL